MNEHINCENELKEDELENINGGIFVLPISPSFTMVKAARGAASILVDYLRKKFKK